MSGNKNKGGGELRQVETRARLVVVRQVEAEEQPDKVGEKPDEAGEQHAQEVHKEEEELSKEEGDEGQNKD